MWTTGRLSPWISTGISASRRWPAGVADQFISPRVQRERIEAYATAHGHRIALWHEDLDQPGSKNERPGFQAALVRVEAKATGGIAVARLDRFARSMLDAAVAIKRITEADGQLVAVESGLDTTTAMGRFGLNVFMAFVGRARPDPLQLEHRPRVRRPSRRPRRIPATVRVPARSGWSPHPREERREGEPPVFQRRAAGAPLSELAGLLAAGGVGRPLWESTVDGRRRVENWFRTRSIRGRLAAVSMSGRMLMR